MAAALLLYLLKANAALLLFAGAYFGLLRRLTFFTLNRAYLVFALLFAAGYPALPVPALLPAEATSAVFFPVVGTTGAAASVAMPAAPAVDWAVVGVALYAAGVAVLLVRLLGQLLALGRLRAQSRPATVQGVPVRVLAEAVSPFSFGQAIYLNPTLHPGPELTAVLRHEQVHVRQWHTLDVLLAQLALAAAWCNPAAWLLRRALLDNLEYLADQAVLEAGLDRRAYQYSLLRLSHGAAGPSLVSHFTVFTLKNRVIMMNSPLSPTGQLARYFVAGPLVLALALGFAAARAQGAGPVVPAMAVMAQPEQDREPVTHYIDGKVSTVAEVLKVGPENTAFMVALKGEEARKFSGNPQDEYVMVITTKQNQNRADVRAFNQKVAAAAGPAASTSEQPATAPPARQRAAGEAAPQAAPPAPPRRVAAPAAAAVTLPGATVPTDAVMRTARWKDSDPSLVYYADGELNDAAIHLYALEDIASVSVLKGERARQLTNQTDARVVVITTKKNQDRPDVLTFNEKLGLAAVPKATESTAYLGAPALAYITKNYPQARLMEMSEVRSYDGSPSRYRAIIVVGRLPTYLLFDAQGQFISEVRHTTE